MKKFFSLVLALVMALSLTTVAWGADPVAKIGDTPYDSLQAAVDAAGAGAIIVLQNDTAVSGVVEGAGVKVPTGKDITIDFNGLTYKITSAVGDYGTLGFQLLKDSDVVLKNGAITSKAGSNVKMLINNYSNLTLYDIMLDGSNLDGNAPNYTLSNNNGDTTIGSGTTIVAKDNGVAFDVCWSDYYTDGAQVTVEDGAVIEGEVALTLWDQTTYDANQSILTVNGGSFDSAITIDDTYGADVDDVKDFVTISDGTFAVAPAEEFLADDFALVQDTNGNYVAAPAVTKGDKFDLYMADKDMATALKLKTPDVAGLSFTDVAAKTNKDGSGNVAYIVANNGEYYVKTTSPYTTSYAVTYAGKTDVLYYVNVGGAGAAYYAYEESVDAFANWGKACGQIDITPVAGKTYFEASDGYVYMAGAAGTGTNYLLDGVVVSGTQIAKPIDHSFTANDFKYDTTLKVNVPTSAICTKCLKTTTSIYAYNKIPATYTWYPIVNVDVQNATTGMTKYVVALAPNASLGGTVTPSTPSTDKNVTSADTFDAGIAMYVGMSVMAAAGGAVVIGKKKD